VARSGVGSATSASERSRGREGGAVATTVILNLACGGGGRPMGWHHAAGEGRERERRGSHLTDERRPVGSGLRPAGTCSVARPCRVAGSTGEREGAYRRAQTHSAGRLRQLTGGPRCIVPGLNKF
jgi:hypothetical protein